LMRGVALLFAGASFGGLFPMRRVSIRGPIRTCPRTLDVRPASPYSAGRAFPGSDPTSDVLCRSQAPSPRLQSERPADRARRYRSCGFDLRARTALRTPGEERTLERSRTPSVVSGPDALFTRRPSTSWLPLKVAARPSHTDSPSLVPSRAFNAAPTSLRLDTHDFRVSTAMCPTDFCHPLPS